MKKTYIVPMTGINEIKVSHFLCASGAGTGSKTISFSTEIPADELTAD
jgi:hypothetical protein